MVHHGKITKKGKMICIIVTVIVLFIASPLFASRPYQPKIADPILEPWRWRSYPELDGKGVQCVTEVSDGSIWFGLIKGAMHYDGLNWTLYDDRNSLLSSTVTIITQVKDGSIYFGTSSSDLIRFSDEGWESVWSPAYTDGREQRVNCIVQTSDQRIWACMWATGILSIQNDHKILFTTHKIGEEIENRHPEATIVEISQEIIDPVLSGLDYFHPDWAHEIKPGNILFAINNHLFSYRLEPSLSDGEGVWSDVTPDIYNKSHFIVKMYTSQDGMIWIYDIWEDSGLFQYDPEHDQWKVFNLKFYGGTNRIMSVQETADGILWVGDFGRFFRYQNGQWRLYQSPELDLPNIDILLLASSDGNLWIMGQRSEVYRIDYGGEYWMTYQGLNYQCEFGNVEWFISVDGRIVSHEKETGKWTSYDTRDGLIDEPVVLLCTRDGTLWAAGSHQRTTATAVFQNGRWMKTIHPDLGYNFEYRSVCELLDGTLLFGVKDRDRDKNQTGGIARYNRSNNLWDYIRRPALLSDMFCSLRQTSDGTIWYGGLALSKLDGETSSVVADHEDFNSSWFDYIEIAPDGALWTIKGGVGVYRYDPVQKTATKYTTEDGLAGVLGSSILCLSDTSVLVATDKGISRFDGHSWTKFGLPEILNIRRESGNMKQSEDGSIWLNMASRFWYQRAMSGQRFTEATLPEYKTIRFKPDRLSPVTHVFMVNDHVPSRGNAYAEWTGMDAWNQSLPEHLEYSYRLNGGDWSPFSEETNHLFLSLKSGDYNLEVRARDGGFNIDSTPAAIRFTVMPPAWRQPWFIGMMVLFLSAIGIFEWRIIQRDQRLRVANVSLHERTEQLQASNTELELTNSQLQDANRTIKQTSKDLQKSNLELKKSKEMLELAKTEELAYEKHLMYALMDTLPDRVYFKDLQSRFIRVNKSLVKLFNMDDPRNIIGKTDFDFFTEEHARPAFEDEQKIMQTGQPLLNVEEKETWPDDHVTWVSTTKVPLRDLEGKIVGTFGVSRDITAHKLAEIELQKAKEDIDRQARELKQFNLELEKSQKALKEANKEALAHEQYMMYALMNNVADKIYFKDRECRFLRVNKATSMAHHIVDPEEMVGKSDFDFFTEEHARPAFEDEQEIMRTGRSLEKEEKETWTDGHETWVSTTKQPLRDLKGNIVGTFGISRDITERKLADEKLRKAKEDITQKAIELKQTNKELEKSERALKRSNEELEQFAYVASHDLQEPLRMVSSYVSLLARRYKDKLDSNAEEFIHYAVDGAQRMQQLINDLLSYSRVTTRGKPFVQTNCEEIFKRVEMNLKIAIEENKAQVKHDSLPTINADGVQLERLFQNLIGNAVKYHGKENPDVSVSAEKNGKVWTFSVKDNGIGIGPDDRERVFGIFQRLHTKEEYPGTGIGLAVCKKIVERHGGEIWVESELGKGSVFKFTMPMMQNA